MRTIILYSLLALVLAAHNLAAQAYGEIRGIIKDTELQPVPFATVKILQGNLLIGGAQSDEEGRYKYKPLTPGSYEVVFMEEGHVTQKVNKVTVMPNDATYLDVKLETNMLGTVTVTAKAYDYSQSGADRKMYSMMSIDAKELNKTAGYQAGNIKDAVTLLVSDAVQTNDGAIHFRGARDGTSSNYIDGIRSISEIQVPGMAIENLTIFTGGVPACYGDVTSGVVIVTTKSYFSGIRDKNIRNAEYKAQREELKRQQVAQEAEKNRAKEIEAEKASNKAAAQSQQGQ